MIRITKEGTKRRIMRVESRLPGLTEREKKSGTRTMHPLIRNKDGTFTCIQCGKTFRPKDGTSLRETNCPNRKDDLFYGKTVGPRSWKCICRSHVIKVSCIEDFTVLRRFVVTGCFTKESQNKQWHSEYHIREVERLWFSPQNTPMIQHRRYKMMSGRYAIDCWTPGEMNVFTPYSRCNPRMLYTFDANYVRRAVNKNVRELISAEVIAQKPDVAHRACRDPKLREIIDSNLLWIYGSRLRVDTSKGLRGILMQAVGAGLAFSDETEFEEYLAYLRLLSFHGRHNPKMPTAEATDPSWKNKCKQLKGRIRDRYLSALNDWDTNDVFKMLTDPGEQTVSARVETLVKAGHAIDIKLVKNCLSHDGRWKAVLASYRLKRNYNRLDWTLWDDYYDIAEKMGLDVSNPTIAAPQDIRAAHDRVLEMQRRRREKQNAEAKRAEMERRRKSFEKFARKDYWHKLHIANGVYVMRTMPTLEEWMEEGQRLHICVYSSAYYEKDKSFVVVVRKADSPDVPYVDVEISTESWTILQLRSVCNQRPDDHDDIHAFVDSHIQDYKNALQKHLESANSTANVI